MQPSKLTKGWQHGDEQLPGMPVPSACIQPLTLVNIQSFVKKQITHWQKNQNVSIRTCQ